MTDSVKIILPEVKPIDENERKFLTLACEHWYDSVLDNSGFNGSVLVAKNGNIIFQKFKGTGHIAGKDTIGNTTSFHIASVSKTFTAMAVLGLCQQGKINLDAEFSSYFPEFNYPGVTIRSMLNHRSGLPNYIYFMEDLGLDKAGYISNHDILATMVTQKAKIKNIGSPNKSFSYCNTNYALLALLIEKVTGLDYPTYMKNEFFRPLGMQHSFVFTHVDSALVNPSYGWRGEMIPLNSLDLVYGDKNIYSTTEDLLTWDRALRSNMIFSAATLEAAYTPYSNEKAGIRNYGLGWRMNIYPNGKKMIYHNGWWHGFNASFIRLLDENTTIIVLGNKFTHAVYKASSLAALFGNHHDADEAEESEPVKKRSIKRRHKRK